MKLLVRCLIGGLLAGSVLTGCSSGGTKVDPWRGETLVWHDEFNGPNIDPHNWTFDLGTAGGCGNNEREDYRAENASIQNVDGASCLVITAKKDKDGNWTSARLNSQGLQSFRYGKIEARIKLPYGQGLWPAFWMLGADIDSSPWPACGETDIMEMIGGSHSPNSDAKVYETLHWADSKTGEHQMTNPNNSYALPFGKFSDGFHVFGVDWTPKRMDWYVDGVLRGSNSLQNTSMGDTFQKPFYLILNLAVGGGWPGYPDDTTRSPQTMAIDWIRVYR